MLCSWLGMVALRGLFVAEFRRTAVEIKLDSQHLQTCRKICINFIALSIFCFLHLSSSLLCYIVLILCISHFFQIKSKQLEHEGIKMDGREEAPSVVFRGTMGL